MNPLSLETPGKINLFLEVKGKRADSWHELLTLFYPVRTLTDRVEIRFGGAGTRICCSLPGVPLNEDNLAAKAARAYFAAAQMPCPGMEIVLEKHLPAAGGMAGGSSDAGAVLRLLQRYSGNALPADRLAQVALSLGSDVPYFLDPAPAVGRGRGEILTGVGLPEDLPLLLIPGTFPISAAWAYAHWKDVPQTGRTGLTDLLPLLAAKNYAEAGKRLRNDLEPAALRKFPLLRMLTDLLRRSGGSPLMSGSGPTLFALYPDPDARDRAFRLCRAETEKYSVPLLKI